MTKVSGQLDGRFITGYLHAGKCSEFGYIEMRGLEGKCLQPYKKNGMKQKCSHLFLIPLIVMSGSFALLNYFVDLFKMWLIGESINY